MADTDTPADTNPALTKLAKDPVWLKLLHYNKAGTSSEIISDDFFLSPIGRIDPLAELLATVEAYQQPWPMNGDTHPRCRFPARYYWLNQKLGLPGYQLRDLRCQTFEKWALLDKIDSISLLLVSGYYGNPASTFGHALVKLNTADATPGADLFDLTINFGAMVPPNEPILLYIMRGLSGGYDAAFSDRYYYAQDLVYSRTEFRDIWDYRLNLTEEQRTLLLLHLWEIMGKRFVYYFLNENCASRLAELLELVTGEDFLQHSSLWYAPIETFHRFDEIDRLRKSRHQATLVDKVQFIPSSQRNLYTQVAQLGEDENKALNNVIREGQNSIDEYIDALSPKGQIRTTNALLAYYQYRITAEQPEPAQELKEGKDKALYKRLTQPSANAEKITTPQLPSPAESAPPLQGGIGLAQGLDEKEYLQLRFTPYTYEKIARNSRDNNEIVVMDTVLDIDKTQQLFLNRFDLIRIRSLQTERIPIEGEERPSWQLRIGTDRIYNQNEYHYDTNAAFGVGLATELNSSATLHAMVDIAAHSYPGALTIEPNIGTNFKLGLLHGELSYRTSIDTVRNQLTKNAHGRLQLQLAKNKALRLELSHTDKKSAVSLSYLHYW